MFYLLLLLRNTRRAVPVSLCYASCNVKKLEDATTKLAKCSSSTTSRTSTWNKCTTNTTSRCSISTISCSSLSSTSVSSASFSSSSIIQQRVEQHTKSPTNHLLFLHHEWIFPINNKNTTAAATTTTTTSTEPNITSENVIVFLHGLLGNCKNLKSLAKRIVEETGVTALMMDLRGHGQSHDKDRGLDDDHDKNNNNNNNNNHNKNNNNTIQNCAEDVIYTLHKLNLVGHHSPKGIVGHSFGGRCALAYHHRLLELLLQQQQQQQQQQMGSCVDKYLHPPKDCWILDSCPGKIHPSVIKVIEAVSSIEMPIKSKKELVHCLTVHHGIDPSIAAWITTNLKSVGEDNQYDFTFDLNVVRDILQDFPRQDMMKMLQECFKQQGNGSGNAVGNHGHGSMLTGNIHMVIASKNNSWTSDILKQLENMRMMMMQQGDGSDKNGGSKLSLLHLNAGHWVHVDALDELVAAIVTQNNKSQS